MKIIILSYAYPPSSFPVARRIDYLFQDLVSRDLNVEVVTTNDIRYENNTNLNSYNDNNIIRINLNSPIYKFKIFKYIKYFASSLFYIFKIRPTLIITSSGRLGSLIIPFLINKIFLINYVVDYRDIFSSNFSEFFFKQLFIKKFIKNILFSIEKKIFENALHVNVVTQGMKKYYDSLGMNTSKWSVITNGFDPKNIKFPKHQPIIKKDKFNIVYTGNIGFGQGFEDTISFIGQNLDKNKFIFHIYGNGKSLKFIQQIVDDNKFNHIQIHDVQSQIKIQEIQSQADMLYFQLSKNKSVDYAIPSKVFEYLVHNKKIVGLINKGNKNQIQKISDNIKIFTHDELLNMITYVNNFKFENQISKNTNFNSYNLKNLMKKFSDLILVAHANK